MREDGAGWWIALVGVLALFGAHGALDLVDPLPAMAAPLLVLALVAGLIASVGTIVQARHQQAGARFWVVAVAMVPFLLGPAAWLLSYANGPSVLDQNEVAGLITFWGPPLMTAGFLGVGTLARADSADHAWSWGLGAVFATSMTVTGLAIALLATLPDQVETARMANEQASPGASLLLVFLAVAFLAWIVRRRAQ